LKEAGNKIKQLKKKKFTRESIFQKQIAIDNQKQGLFNFTTVSLI